MTQIEELILRMYGYKALREYQAADNKQEVIDKLLDNTFVKSGNGQWVNVPAVHVSNGVSLIHSLEKERSKSE